MAKLLGRLTRRREERGEPSNVPTRAVWRRRARSLVHTASINASTTSTDGGHGPESPSRRRCCLPRGRRANGSEDRLGPVESSFVTCAPGDGAHAFSRSTGVLGIERITDGRGSVTSIRAVDRRRPRQQPLAPARPPFAPRSACSGLTQSRHRWSGPRVRSPGRDDRDAGKAFSEPSRVPLSSTTAILRGHHGHPRPREREPIRPRQHYHCTPRLNATRLVRISYAIERPGHRHGRRVNLFDVGERRATPRESLRGHLENRICAIK